MSCFSDVLRHLAPPDCLHRKNYSAHGNSPTTTSTSSSAAAFPIYVLHAPWLTRRHDFMHGQLKQLGAADVTWVICSNRGEVDALSPSMRACAYPCVQLNRYFNVNQSTNVPLPLSNGTISLALKHKIAAWDIVQRKLSSGLVLEDDAVLPPDLFRALSNVGSLPQRLGSPVDIFWMGSYSSRKNVGTLNDHTKVSPPRSETTGGLAALTSIRKRNATRFPPIFGAVAYVLFEPAARLVSSEPVTTAADIAISFYPRAGITHTVGRSTPARVFPDATCDAEDGVNYKQRTPSEQYGPPEWIIWPVAPGDQPKLFGDHGGTHGVAPAGATSKPKDLPTAAEHAHAHETRPPVGSSKSHPMSVAVESAVLG